MVLFPWRAATAEQLVGQQVEEREPEQRGLEHVKNSHRLLSAFVKNSHFLHERVADEAVARSVAEASKVGVEEREPENVE